MDPNSWYSTFSRWRSSVLNHFPGTTRFRGDSESMTQSLTEGSSNNRNASTDYTELHGGSVPCPSCKGSGLIPKELEGTLVALIPVNDERLQPKRTCLTVTFWVALCILIGSIILFLLMPRTVTLSSNHMPVALVHVTDRDANHSTFIEFNFLNKINITSGNYIPVSLVNITATVINRFMPYSSGTVGHGGNATFSDDSPLVLYRTTRELMFNNTVRLTGSPALFCQQSYWTLTPIYTGLQFDLIATVTYYYGHTEQVTLSTTQQVCCIPSGNCTADVHH